jgi:excinuclease ABC subunit A
MAKEIIIKGAKTHNLKNIRVNIPKDCFCVITGLSGSGKSSLAFDTIYAEGQRKYVESLSSYARQFLQLMDKPDVEYIEGLSPAISIEQKSTSHNPRSTVGTITEIYDYLRVLYARIGEARCPQHGNILKASTIKQMQDEILKIPTDSKIMILAPIVRNRKGEYKLLLDNMARAGYIRAKIDGEICDLSDPPELDLHKKHNIEIIIDRLKKRDDDIFLQRIADSLETALKLTNGIASVSLIDEPQINDLVFSQNYSCLKCGYSIQELEPRNFSFNNPAGACPTCLGLGAIEIFLPDSFIVDEYLTLREGAIKYWSPSAKNNFAILSSLAKHYGFSLDTPYNQLSNNIKDLIFFGNNNEQIEIKMILENGGLYQRKTSFDGVIQSINKKFKEGFNSQKEELSKYITARECTECNGARLKEAYRNVFINNLSLPQLGSLTIKENLNFFKNLKLSLQQETIANRLIKEITSRLQFLVNVGLDYLTINRSADTLSGGESQRIRLASQIGSGLTGVMYVLDEPSIGLHQRDNEKLLESLFHLRDLGNSVIVVEHDEDTIRKADHIIDVGPGAGIHGGQIVAQGSINDIVNEPSSITGMYLSGVKKIAIPKRKAMGDKFIKLSGAKGNNLKNISISIPCGLLTCVTGVSGSGKSTLVNNTLYIIAQKVLNNAKNSIPDPYQNIEGLEYFDKVINIDQSPIGRTPRSNPATYVDFFTAIRELFANTRESRARGYTPGRFSFNIKGGRCEACHGDGVIKVEMNFLPDVYVKCDECCGKRFNKETLDITYKNKTIQDVLNMSVEEALEFFEAIPTIKKKLQTLSDVGLSYITLGQQATTLSGGEAQRIKLAKELSKISSGKTLYILDEPTTGLHFQDVDMLLNVLFKLRDAGNTIVVIEHNLDVIKCADYIIDLGPEGGNNGGEVIAIGTPEQVSKNEKSYTGIFLNKIL